MLRFVILLLVALVGWKAYDASQGRPAPKGALSVAAPLEAPKQTLPAVTAFKCDGRTYCSQMTSCQEATYFLKNCPGTKMDGNHDGVPCEQQWCH